MLSTNSFQQYKFITNFHLDEFDHHLRCWVTVLSFNRTLQLRRHRISDLQTAETAKSLLAHSLVDRTFFVFK